jgi:hypothetical protein
VQDGILGKIDENRQAVALATTDYDEIDVALACDSDYVGLHDSNFNLTVCIRHAEFGGKRRQACACARDQLILYPYGVHECLANGSRRYELYYVQELDLCSENCGDGLRPPTDWQAVGDEINGDENATIDRHRQTR